MEARRVERATDVRVRRISLVIPMYNERDHIDALVSDIAAQDWEGELQVLVADGRSTDGSRGLLRAAATRAALDVTILDNPKRQQSAGLNLCIAQADGDLIVRLDCHTRYPPNLLRLLVRASEETGAWNVGGTFAPRGRTVMERAVACAYDSPFGGTGWTKDQLGRKRVEADLVYYGAFRPIVFERVGGYDEGLPVAEVEDLCRRIRDAGGTVVFDPAIKLYYTPRGSLHKLFVQYYRYGLWKVAAMTKHGRVLSGRSVVPFVFVVTLATLATASPRSRAARRALAVEAGTYATAALAFAAESVRRRREPAALVPRVAAAFATFHLAHGLGQVHGWLRQARRLAAADRQRER
jgi:glycosyltransferase involved in cell wall biosynthesis